VRRGSVSSASGKGEPKPRQHVDREKKNPAGPAAGSALREQPSTPAPRYTASLTGICSTMDFIRIRGARTHNLKNIDLDLPRDS
jgi:Excinuclease ATPase subunit